MLIGDVVDAQRQFEFGPQLVAQAQIDLTLEQQHQDKLKRLL